MLPPFLRAAIKVVSYAAENSVYESARGPPSARSAQVAQWLRGLPDQVPAKVRDAVAQQVEAQGLDAEHFSQIVSCAGAPATRAARREVT